MQEYVKALEAALQAEKNLSKAYEGLVEELEARLTGSLSRNVELAKTNVDLLAEVVALQVLLDLKEAARADNGCRRPPPSLN